MIDDLILDMDERLPLRDVVYNTLRNAILRGELLPGERLMEMHLANKLGVSRTPIREAIKLLEDEGLAVTVPRKGAQVAKMTEKDLQDVLEIRNALDELAVSMACARKKPEQLQTLKEALESFEFATKSKDPRKIAEEDEKFHNVIYEMADNPKLTRVVVDLREQMYRYRYEYVKDNETYEKLIQEHKEMIAGLENNDVEHLKEIMHTHLSNQVEAVREVIKEQE
ncbi:MAG: GntR family transcriptional regulator [Lachnospiraceae bacterium]|nr:GntR family transcriptional regulator [Lachnospiraceae bacterium]